MERVSESLAPVSMPQNRRNLRLTQGEQTEVLRRQPRDQLLRFRRGGRCTGRNHRAGGWKQLPKPLLQAGNAKSSSKCCRTPGRQGPQLPRWAWPSWLYWQRWGEGLVGRERGGEVRQHEQGPEWVRSARCSAEHV